MSNPNKIKIKTGSEASVKLHKEVGQLSCDIFHTDKEIIILAPIAGTKRKDIQLSITKEILTIRGRRPSKYKADEENYYTKECFWGNFSRSIILPLEADVTKITADFEDNVLEIKIPRVKNQKRTKIIKIKSSIS